MEMQIAVSRLLTYLFSEDNDSFEINGRYQFLEKAIEKHPKFLNALLVDNRDAALRIWQEVIKKNKSNMVFQHGFAVICREQAVASLDKKKPNEGLCTLSTVLWIYLLCSKKFWVYFSKKRFTERDSNERKSLEPQQQEYLFKETWQSILVLHNNYGRQDFTAGENNRAKIHLSCLDLCRADNEKLAKTLSKYNIPYNLNLDMNRRQLSQDMAQKILDDWGSTLVNEAEKITEDAEAIQNLPQGIRKNYEGGIRHLEAFIDLDILVIRVLRTILQFYNEWCYDLYLRKEIQHIKKLMQSACGIADKLAPMFIKGRGHIPENKALSQHFLIKGFAEDEPEQSIKYYEEALAWDPMNDNAKSLLEGSTQKNLMTQIETAMECMKRKQFTEAYEVLDSVEEQITDKKQYQMARAIVCFQHAQALAGEGKFNDALIRVREAKQNEPHEQVIQDFLEQMEELAPEEDNIQHMHKAEEAYKKDDYDSTINETSKVEKQSKSYVNARTLQSAAHFRRGIEAANKGEYNQAVDDLEQALEMNKNKEEQKIIASQLEIVKMNKIFYELDKAVKSRDWNRAEKILQHAMSGQISSKEKKIIKSHLSGIYIAQAIEILNSINGKQRAKELLEKAIKLDGSNKTARQYLKKLKEVM